MLSNGRMWLEGFLTAKVLGHLLIHLRFFRGLRFA